MNHRKQPDPFGDLNVRAPINTEYMGVQRKRREPREQIQITGSGLAKRKVIKPKEESQKDIFDDLCVED